MNNRNRQKARQPTPQSKVPQSKPPQSGTLISSRQILRALNTGYDEGGANQSKGSMRAWNPLGSSPQSDIDSNLSVLRSRSRSLYMNAPLATSAIVTSRTHVVGAGLVLRSKINTRVLGMTDDEATEWQKKTQDEFEVWASSKFCDLTKKNNFYDLQDIAYIGYLLNGDSWAAIKYRNPLPGMPYQLRLQLFEADRVSNPDSMNAYGTNMLMVQTKNPGNGNRIINGVEIDSDGAIAAYWICNRYPYDPTNISSAAQWTRVEAFGKKSGMPNILQVTHDERSDQYRGVPYLAPAIEAFKQVTRYTEAELTAAIIKAFFTLFFTQEIGASNGSFPMTEPVADEEKVSLNANDFELGAGSMNVLPPGYTVKEVDASRSQSTFEVFTNSIIRQIAASIEQPYEVLVKAFQSSYSASRAALLQAWAAYKMRRVWFSRDFCQPVYEAWLTEAVASGRISAPEVTMRIYTVKMAKCI